VCKAEPGEYYEEQTVRRTLRGHRRHGDLSHVSGEAHPVPAPQASPVNTAIYACEQWTRTNSKLAVGEITGRYEITGRKKLKAEQYRVGIDYRTTGVGMLMRSECLYQHTGKGVVLLSAESSLAP
jgi:hypothetical protein